MGSKAFVYFDHAATTRCCEESAAALARFASEEYANPSSSHALGQQAARAIREARQFFADTFGVDSQQIIFTGSGSESDNLGIYGPVLDRLWKRESLRAICSATEHAAIKKSVQSLGDLGADIQFAGVNRDGKVTAETLGAVLSTNTAIVSIHQANNITGAHSDTEALAALTKAKAPSALFHSDCVQAFGKMPVPRAGSAVDYLSIAAHKIEGPKGIGALIVLNREAHKKLRPQIWGGGQEHGLRAGTQNTGAIYGFYLAAKKRLERLADFNQKVTRLQAKLRSALQRPGLECVNWNSPADALPHVVSLSVPGYPGGPLAKLLEERGYLVSTGSACSSQKTEPDAVLAAMGLPLAAQTSAIRLSFSDTNTEEQVDGFAAALAESIQLMTQLLGMKPQK